MNQDKTTRRLGWGLAMVGVVLAAISAFLVVSDEGTDDWVETEAVVVETDKDDGVIVGSTLRFRDPEDNSYDVATGFGDEETRRGTKVMVRYNPDNPTQILLEGEEPGLPSHFYFAVVFGLIAVWGVVIALWDPQLPDIPTRPEGVSATAVWMVLSTVIAGLALRGRLDGIAELGMWALVAVGAALAYGIWRVMYPARLGAIAFAGLMLVIVVVNWARNDNRWGAPLFWNLLLAGAWALVILALNRKEVAKAFARMKERRLKAAAAA